MRISDWSSDVCSSDLPAGGRDPVLPADVRAAPGLAGDCPRLPIGTEDPALAGPPDPPAAGVRRHDRRLDRKSVVYGTSVSVRVDLGGRRILKKQTAPPPTHTTPLHPPTTHPPN